MGWKQKYSIFIWALALLGFIWVGLIECFDWGRTWAMGLADPYPAPTSEVSEGIVIIPHRVAEGTMVSVQIDENFIICDTTPGGLQCQSANISAIYIEEGEIHLLTYGQSGYVCTVAGCREFVY